MKKISIVLQIIFLTLFGFSLFGQNIKPIAEFERISDRVLLLKTGKVYTDQIMAIATKKGIVVIDAGNSETQTKEYRKIIEREFGRNDFIYLINTHSHSDHTGGNQVFADINIIAHERVPDAMKQSDLTRKSSAERGLQYLSQRISRLNSMEAETEEKQRLRDLIGSQEIYSKDYLGDFRLTLPTITFSDKMTLDLGDVTLKLYYYGEGAHIGDDIMIYCPEEKIVFSGDLLYRKSFQFAYFPKFDAPLWISILGEILKKDDDVKWVFDTHNGRMTGKFLALRYKYMTELWNDLSNEKGKNTEFKTILEKYPFDKYSYILESGLDHSYLVTEHENNLMYLRLCINNAQSGKIVLEQVLKEFGIEAVLQKYSQIKTEIGVKYFFNEEEMNTWGYNLISEKKINEAIEVFKLNIDLFPSSANTYDSLAEAYMNAGNKELAIKNYEKSLELNPQNTNAVEQLKKLK